MVNLRNYKQIEIEGGEDDSIQTPLKIATKKAFFINEHIYDDFKDELDSILTLAKLTNCYKGYSYFTNMYNNLNHQYQMYNNDHGTFTLNLQINHSGILSNVFIKTINDDLMKKWCEIKKKYNLKVEYQMYNQLSSSDSDLMVNILKILKLSL